jgi:hypothetical protein
MEAARILGEIKELSAVDPLISLLKEDKDWGGERGRRRCLGEYREAFC